MKHFPELNRGKCKTYVIACERTGKALLIDPLRENISRYLAFLAYSRLTLDAADRHAHPRRSSDRIVPAARPDGRAAHHASARAGARRDRARRAGRDDPGRRGEHQGAAHARGTPPTASACTRATAFSRATCCSSTARGARTSPAATPASSTIPSRAALHPARRDGGAAGPRLPRQHAVGHRPREAHQPAHRRAHRGRNTSR